MGHRRQINAYLNTRRMPPRASLALHHVVQGGPPGAVGAFYDELSRDLAMHGRTLQQCEQFFRYFPKFKPDKGLKWSHYRFLLAVPDAALRRAWIERIKKEKISTDQLRLMLMPAGATDDLPEFDLKNPVRGKLYTYRLLRADEVENFDVPWFVDLGFAGCVEAPPAKAALDNKYIYPQNTPPQFFGGDECGKKPWRFGGFRPNSMLADNPQRFDSSRGMRSIPGTNPAKS